MYAMTAKGMRYMDDYTIGKGLPSAVLMENAARGVVDELVKRFPSRKERILVLAGPGNNGGDALCAARWLMHLGYDVAIYFIGDASHASNEFVRQAGILTEVYPRLAISGIRGGKSDASVLSREYDIILDGMYGIGLNRRFGANFIKFIDYINSKNSYRIAIDVPSGLNATTGQAMNAVIKADLTVTFANYKTGMFFADGREACGEIVLIDIGIDRSGYSEVSDKLFICDNEFFESTFDRAIKPRKERSHKGTYGTVGIIIGQTGMMGAGMLAAKAAYRSGCGLVKIFCPNKFTGFFNVYIPEAVVVPYRADDVIGALNDFVREVDAILIGPGLNEDSTGRLLVRHVLSGTTPCVLDAGALNIISRNLKPLRKRKCKCVITPHIGEMSRLCGEDIHIVEKNIIGFTKKFSEKYNVSMVSKSDVSVISLINSESEQRLFLNTLGNSGLATAGSGDVLSGTIVSLLAQGNSVNSSLLYGVMAHGRAAEKICHDQDSKRRMMAGDIIENLF